MGKKTMLNPQQIKPLEEKRNLHILLAAMLFLLSWIIVSVTVVANATEYDASEVDKPPKLVRQMDLRYPPQAQREKLEGRVVIRCVITSKGKVDKMEIVESDPEGVFDDSAMKSVKYWSFRPGVKDGEMVDTWIKIPLTFQP